NLRGDNLIFGKCSHQRTVSPIDSLVRSESHEPCLFNPGITRVIPLDMPASICIILSGISHKPTESGRGLVALTERSFQGHAFMPKHIFVTGGVVSSLGKGLTSASIGMLLEHRGLRVRMQKFDPYINVDPGTMNPYQHGEVYVLDDGAETDLDLGH